MPVSSSIQSLKETCVKLSVTANMTADFAIDFMIHDWKSSEILFINIILDGRKISVATLEHTLLFIISTTIYLSCLKHKLLFHIHNPSFRNFTGCVRWIIESVFTLISMQMMWFCLGISCKLLAITLVWYGSQHLHFVTTFCFFACHIDTWCCKCLLGVACFEIQNKHQQSRRENLC